MMKILLTVTCASDQESGYCPVEESPDGMFVVLPYRLNGAPLKIPLRDCDYETTNIEGLLNYTAGTVVISNDWHNG